MLQEVSRIRVSITKNEETSISWHNSIITARTDKGLHIYKLSRNIMCLGRQINYKSAIIPIPKHSPTAQFFTRKLMKTEMSNLEFTQMTLDSLFWPHNPLLVEEMTNIVSAQFSPDGMIHKNESVLAILNNIGNIEFFGPNDNTWTSIVNLSEIIKDRYLSTIDNKMPTNLEDLRLAVNTVGTISFCWGPKHDDTACYFATAQGNGSILVWTLQFAPEVKVELQNVIETNNGAIHSMTWIQKSLNKFLLLCSNMLGQIHVYNNQIENNSVIVNHKCLWEHKDRMISKYLVYTVLNNNVVLLCNKHRHLLALMFDDNLNIISQCTKNLNDYRVTDIKQSNYGIYLCTVNCKMYKIDVKFNHGNLEVNTNEILKDAFPTYEFYNFGVSNNNVLFALGLYDRKVIFRQRIDHLDIVLVSPHEELEINLLLNNPTNRLTNYWDCLEVLRYRAMKSKIFPNVDLTELYTSADSNIYKLKLYLILLIIYNNSQAFVFNAETEVNIPEKSIEKVKDQILLHQAKSVMTDLYKLYKQNNYNLDKLNCEYFVGARNFVQHYCTKYKQNINDVVDEKNWSINAIQYICQCCDEVLNGLSCSNGHLNMFCSITFTPIDSNDYLVCEACNCTARIELYKNNPTCLFCDLYMDTCYLPS